MKKFLYDYVAFNTWANNRMCDAAAKLTEEQLTQEMKSSFPSIRATMLHIMEAQDIWLERFDGHSPSSWPTFTGTSADLIEGLRKSSKALEAKVKSYDKKGLKKEVSYITLKGIAGNSQVYQMFAHVANHGTYHRGQLITMFRTVGVSELPATDLIAFFREKKAK